MSDSTRAATTIQPTGNAEIDGVLSGNKWAPDADGKLTTVTFGFPASGDLYKDQPADRTEHQTKFEAVTSFQQANLQKYVDHIHKFSNLRLEELKDIQAGDAAIRLAWTGLDQEGAGGWADQPGNYPDAGDVWISSIGTSATTTDTTEPLFIFIHELGHALGLKHPHEADGFTTILPSKYDGPEYTSQSYNMSAVHKDAVSFDLTPQTWMWHDIQALQTLYGKNTTSTAGSDTYAFDLTKRHFLTIWDAGGRDTIKLTGSKVNTKLNLTPGTWSDIGTTVNYSTQVGGTKTLQETLFIAPDTTIEKAFGAEGDDTITGNDANNVLKGNGGNDVLKGGSGNDFLSGGTGSDRLMGEDGDDQLFAGPGDQGNDTVDGGAGADIIGGGSGDDSLMGGSGKDTLYGGRGDNETAGTNDTIEGGDNDDLVYASGGNDSVDGGAGNDTLFGGKGNDTIVGGAGADTLWGGAGDDILTGSEGADTFKFIAGHGKDQITDFYIGEDKLTLAQTVTDFNSAADVQAAAHTTQLNGTSGVSIDTGGGDSLFLAGLTLSDVANIEFEF